MRPCSYNEAWGSIITSHKSRQGHTSPPRAKKQHSVQIPETDGHSWIYAKKDSRDNIESQSVDCSACLLHFISCPSCQSKLKQFSKVYMSGEQSYSNINDQSVSPLQNSSLPPNSPLTGTSEAGSGSSGFDHSRYTYDYSPFGFSLSPDKNQYRYMDSANNLYMYILIGIILGYIICQMLTKRA